MGDTGDNGPGVPGIGPKTAAKLINEFGDLESVLAAAPMMKKSKMQENLLAHSEMARLSRKLVDLHCEVPLPQPLETLALEGIPADPLRSEEHTSELQSLMRISYAVFCLKKKKNTQYINTTHTIHIEQ